MRANAHSYAHFSVHSFLLYSFSWNFIWFCWFLHIHLCMHVFVLRCGCCTLNVFCLFFCQEMFLVSNKIYNFFFFLDKTKLHNVACMHLLSFFLYLKCKNAESKALFVFSLSKLLQSIVIHDIIYKFNKMILELMFLWANVNLKAITSLKLTRHPHFISWLILLLLFFSLVWFSMP